MSDLKWWQSLGGVASVVAAATNETKEEKFDEMGTMMGGGIAIVAIIFVVAIVITILLVVLAYKMFPENKFMHALLTFILGLFWLIPAMLYYLFVLDGYHMQGIHIVKRKGRKH